MSLSPSEGGSALLTLSNNLAAAVEQVGSAVVAVNARRRMSSSGVYWRSGVVVTADHTVKREEEITVTLPDNRTVPATLVGRDSSTDLAVLKLNVELPTVEIGSTESLKVGHLVLAVGRAGESGLSASMGVVSSLGGAWRSWHGGQIDQFVRLDLTPYPGLSGGPLVDASGRIVGINTSGPRGMVLTIPTATVNRVIGQLLEKGHVVRGYLGLGMQPVRLPENLKQTLNLPSAAGIIVVNVEPDGPSDRAGVLLGDVLVTLDGKPLSDTGDVQSMLGSERVNQSITAQIIRGGAPIELAIVVGERLQRQE